MKAWRGVIYRSIFLNLLLFAFHMRCTGYPMKIKRDIARDTHIIKANIINIYHSHVASRLSHLSFP